MRCDTIRHDISFSLENSSQLGCSAGSHEKFQVVTLEDSDWTEVADAASHFSSRLSELAGETLEELTNWP